MTLPKTKTLLIAVAALAVTAAPAAAQSVVSTPSKKTLYRNGPSGRYLMDGTWLRKLTQRPERPAARDRHVGLDEGDRPERLERRRQQRRVVRGRGRLVPQGLPLPEQQPQPLLGRALRVGQLPLEGVAQRQADRDEPRRVPAVRVPPAQGPHPPGQREPPRDPRRQPAPADRLPARGALRDRRADRRLVELRRPAARGLPPADQRHRLQHGRRAAEPPVRHVRRDDPLPGHGAQLRREGAARHRPGALRHQGGRPRHEVGRAGPLRDLHEERPDREPAPVVARQPDALQRPAHGQLGRARRCSATRCAPASARSRSSAAACSSTAGR